MNCNIGCFERNLRILAGTVLVTLAFTHNIGAWGWLGLIPLATGIIRFCPLYTLLNRSGCCKTKKDGCGCN
jgi:hypothetical protein